MTEPVWLIEARKNLGVKETKGGVHTSEVLKYWQAIKRGGIKDDETPWCAAFVGAMLERTGIKSSRFESAKSYLNWGQLLAMPVVGGIVICPRGGGGRVGFAVGRDVKGNLLVLGGNQGDEVNIKAFPVSRVTGYRWPIDRPIPVEPLPTLGAAQLSKSEA